MEHQVYCTYVKPGGCCSAFCFHHCSFLHPASLRLRAPPPLFVRPVTHLAICCWPCLAGSYDPEAFPGLTYRMTTPYDVVILVFHRYVDVTPLICTHVRSRTYTHCDGLGFLFFLLDMLAVMTHRPCSSLITCFHHYKVTIRTQSSSHSASSLLPRIP